jgi:ubiquinone/menaquinone biosynthesis C-methylase UbiE
LKHAKEKVYDDVYGRKEISYEPSRGVISFLYKKLSRFEVNRYQACYGLLPPNKERLLDVGCGDGEFLFMAKAKFEECYGVDVSPLRIERAKEKSKERQDGGSFHFYECDVDEELPFSESFFDAVSCIAVLEHLFNPPNAVEEIHRVLKPNGVFIVEVPNIAWIPYRIQLLLGKLPQTGGVYLGADWEHLHDFTESTLCRLLKAKGFEIGTVSCSGIFAKYRKRWPSALGADLVVKTLKQKNSSKMSSVM